MFCRNCGKLIKGNSKFCGFCGSQQIIESKNNSSVDRLKRINRSALIIVIIVVCIIGFGIYSFFVGGITDGKKQAGNIYRDVIYNTETAPEEYAKYKEVLSDLFDYYNSEHKRLLAGLSNEDFSDLLEISSFKSVSRMKEIVQNLNIALDGIKNLKSEFNNIIIGSEKIVLASSLSQEEKEDMIKGFKESMDSKAVIRNNYWLAIENAFRTNIELYSFLLSNFDDYKIDLDDNYEENIFFYSDENLEIYNDYTEKVNINIERFTQAENAYFSSWEDYGLDAEDFYNIYE